MDGLTIPQRQKVMGYQSQMAQASTSGRGLRRFRAALAEIEQEIDLCPDCDTLLIPMDPSRLKGIPGEIATLLPYRYCEKCENYYLHGKENLHE